MPILVFDPAGTLVFYNESAEVILGRRFSETGSLTLGEWTSSLVIADDDGVPLKSEDRPITVSITERRPTHRRFWLRGFDQVSHYIEATSFPMVGLENRQVGAIAVFWELPT